jgi:hypothetical protein
LWNLHYTPVLNVAPDYPIAAVYRNTAPINTSPWVMPGKYSVVLKVDGKSYTQSLTVKIDPRVKTPLADLQKQFDLSKQLYDMRLKLEPISEALNALSGQLEEARKRGAKDPLASQMDALDKKLIELSGATNHRPGTQLSLGIIDKVSSLFGRLQEVDAAPVTNVEVATVEVVRDSNSIIQRWKEIEEKDIPTIRQQFKLSGLPDLKLTGRQIKYHSISDEDVDDDEDTRTEP